MSYTILLVDDVKINRLVMENILSKTEDVFDFIHASNGEVAKDILDTFSVDLVISDLMMPQMDGYALIRWMKSKAATQQIPIMIYTASHDLASIKTCLNLGIADYFFKPLSQAEVQVIVPLKVKQALKVYENQKKSDKLCVLENELIHLMLLKNASEKEGLKLETGMGKPFPIMDCFHHKSKNEFWILLFHVLNEEYPPALPLFLTTFSRRYAKKIEAAKEVKKKIKTLLGELRTVEIGVNYELQIFKVQSNELYLDELGSFHLSIIYKNGELESYKASELERSFPLNQVDSLLFSIKPLARKINEGEWAYKYSFNFDGNRVKVGLVHNLQ